MARNFNELLAPIMADPERAARLEAGIEETRADYYASQLAEARRLAGLNQTEVAAVLGISQGAVSAFEASADPKLSTLTRYVEALGGTLEVTLSIGGEQLPILVQRSACEPTGIHT